MKAQVLSGFEPETREGFEYEIKIPRANCDWKSITDSYAVGGSRLLTHYTIRPCLQENLL